MFLMLGCHTTKDPMTDLTPSQEILRLCKELGVEPPEHSLYQYTDAVATDPPRLVNGPESLPEYIKEHTDICVPVYTASDLLKWDGWTLPSEFGIAINSVGDKFYPYIVSFFSNGDTCIETSISGEYRNDPDTALQHLVLARLRQIKQEKEK